MRTFLSLTLIITFIFGGLYFYREAEAICAVPLSYRIGSVDERFALSFDEARLAVADAEAAWEDATERNLFTYDETANFAINFIFDERQALADAETNFKNRLNATEGLTDAMRTTYDDLVAEYEKDRMDYLQAVEAYEDRLQSYNATVREYNEDGGAPPEAFDNLADEKAWLRDEQQNINQQAERLNESVEEINQVGNRSNQLIDTYNQTVETFNDTFGEGREFTQGDYQGKQINIYTFDDPEELRLVLTHELGHALSLEHTESPTAVMHYLLGTQAGYQPTMADVELFQSICGASTIEKIRMQLSALVSELQTRLGQ